MHSRALINLKHEGAVSVLRWSMTNCGLTNPRFGRDQTQRPSIPSCMAAWGIDQIHSKRANRIILCRVGWEAFLRLEEWFITFHQQKLLQRRAVQPTTETGLEAIERLRFLASFPLTGTGKREGGEKTQPFNCFPSHLVMLHDIILIYLPSWINSPVEVSWATKTRHAEIINALRDQWEGRFPIELWICDREQLGSKASF